MSVPFSNTTLRIPRGFGTLLEGLSREVLREQPRDIIEFAAEYFEDLLKIRTDSGIDPADWAAQLEDRFYNNYAFKEKQTPKPENEPKSAPLTVDTAHQEKSEGILGQAKGVKRVRKICIKKPHEQTVSMMQQDEERLSKQPGVSGLTDKTTSRLTEPKEDQLEEKSQVLTGAAPEQGPLDDTDSKAPEEAIMEDTTLQITGAGTEVGLLEGAYTQEISATSEQGQMEGSASGVIATTPEKIHQKKSASSMMLAPSKTVSEEDTAPQMITTASADGQEENIQSIHEPPMDEERLSKQPGVSGLTDKTTSRLTEPKEDQLEEKSQVLTGAAPEQGPLDDTDSKAPEEAIMEDTTLQITGAGTEVGLLEGAYTQEISATSEQGQMEGSASGVIATTPEKIHLKKSASSMMLAPSETVSEENTAPQMIPLEEKSQVLTGAAPEQGSLDDTISKAPEEDIIESTTTQIIGAGTEGGLLVGTNSEVIIDAQTAGSLEVTDTQVISATSEQGQLEDTASEIIGATPEAVILKKSASSKEDIASQIITTASADGQEEKIHSTEELPMNTSKNEDHAAAVIQSVYRGYSTRKKLKENASSHPE